MPGGNAAERRKSLFEAVPPQPKAPPEPAVANVNARRQVLMGDEQRTTRGMAKVNSREVVVEDGFTYKRRKSAAVPQQQPPPQQQQRAGAARGGGGRGSLGAGQQQQHANHASGSRPSSGYHHRGGPGPSTSPHHGQQHSQHGQHQHQHEHQHQHQHQHSLPADYPGLHLHERVPADLPEDERFQMLVAEICEVECEAERENLMREHGAVEGAKMAQALQSAMSEFQYKMEELIVRGDIKFDQGGAALREMRDAKQEAMRAVATQLEDESAQWVALEQATSAGAGVG
eukprot:CAMPEP_0181362160 /NCGR_PEP_ID=MMETSP1106-20121128/7809_1 /TAXON_ID=81844 /ORGANISM="Mantoniella antarctica, Strain SL-175" /LENGTH=286 /DNA_ID=CAMNT_0023475997 /DNA_START=68 /DNA_END=924 /DNA_ORIENTATION=+